ncbi:MULTISPECIES: superoxide dismutase [Modicisalibacter]|uniref:superoxide dismutase n=1 Tax=Modicisalibacter TaxID=574347 RepID=UPI00100AB762|nr:MULTISPECIES: superoxide dismutase [Halomonadaceae]MBZ9558324.1 superoxide dismutase [Modicisalibacter sp. R2A 31.J]MBZ9575784.1 superoxide dismutase [Modicisalibacter sp. MOD 31.J]
MIHEFPDLPYAYDALEPVIDETTMKVHHTKHHRAYYDKFVDAIKGTEMEDQPLETIFAKVSQQSAAVRNQGGGYYNHTLYWNVMSPNGGGDPTGALGEAIKAKYGSADEFKKAFAAAATGQFGSGFAWLVVKPDGELEITSTANQDNPLMDVASVRGTPVLGCDVWEHAYYLTYMNRRPEYIENWWKVVNWDYANSLYEQAKAA